jgi:ubiquinone/menaquinone biosynthesis C-methylase UbiE
MNLLHRWICRSGYWKRTVETELLPWSLGCLGPGDNVLEIGPGYGFATDVIRRRVGRLTCVEIDASLAATVSRRLRQTNVTVVQADATIMPLFDASFTAAVCFTMLHHVPSITLQDRLLSEVARVLRPGGWFAGTDSLSNGLLRAIHFGDTMNPVDPSTFADRLRTAGFTDIEIDVSPRTLRFRARRPM